LKAKIKVYLKEAILDPQGKAVLHAINELNFKNAHDVRIGKYIEIRFNGADREQVTRDTEKICQKLLSNPVMENFDFEIEESD
jgi:phosphoribosylformylglycinamidine synthase PurS subunit